ncbi:uncharacterized protein J3D65DRAFT_625817 [Phyllosticta citribraziliensis]|uniref:Apple domain-containing protein n=1 Tax=Phyllosticta citribraziliensis TaxID=989973 RepID=A0ABR1LQP0_9PEZI
MLQPTGAPAAEPAVTAPPSKRNELEKRQALTVWSIPYCGTVFSTSIIPRGTTYVQALSTMVDTITSLSRNTIWATVTAANPTIFLNVSSTVTRMGTQPALTKTAIVNIPRGTVSETIIDTLFRTVYPPSSPICGATLFDPLSVSIFQSFTGFNPTFSNLITATTLNYFAGNQLTLQPLPTTPSFLSGFPSLAPSSAPVSPFATTITPGISVPSIFVSTFSIPDVSPTPPEVSSPSVPSVSIPSVSAPVVSIPSVSAVPPASSPSPSVLVPSFSVPSISIPAPFLAPASSSSLGLPSSSISVINVSGAGQSSSISVAIPSVSIGSSAPSLSLPTALSSSSTSSSATSTPSSSTSTTNNNTSTFSSSTAAPTVICPNGNGTVVTTPDGSTFAVECTWDRIGGDLGSKSAASLNQCLQFCSETANCIQVSFVLPNPPGDLSPCYMKNTIMAPNVNQNIWGARKLTSGSALPSISSSSSTTSTALTAATSYLAAPAGPTCPSANNTVYTVPITGGRFLINCGFDAEGQNMAANPRWASVDRSLWNANLMAQCDATPGCTWISASGNAGYFKSSVDSLRSQSDIVGMRKLSGSVRVKRNFWDRGWGFGTWGTRGVQA